MDIKFDVLEPMIVNVAEYVGTGDCAVEFKQISVPEESIPRLIEDMQKFINGKINT